MTRLKEFFDGWLYGTPDDRRKEIKERAKDLFQIVEHEHLVWITFNGSLFCPYHLINEKGSIDDCVSFVNTLRLLYEERLVKELELEKR